jgi:hypothetical protein
MADVIDFPEGLTNRDPDWFLEGESYSGGGGLSGLEQVVNKENRRWVAQIIVGQIKFQKVPIFRAFVDSVRGRQKRIRIPVCNLYGIKDTGNQSDFLRNIGYSAADILRGYDLYSDGTEYDDGTGFEQPNFSVPIVSVPAVVGDFEVNFSGYVGQNLPVGTYFSIDDFLYRVEKVEQAVITINPPLRQALQIGQAAEVTNPKIQVRFQTDKVGRFAASFERFAPSVPLSVVEAFDR